MGIVYLKCSHGNLVKDCLQCAIEKDQVKQLVYDRIKENKDTRTPILRGCTAAEHGGCFCTGRCQEIVGYQD